MSNQNPNRVTAAVSHDEGETWQAFRDVDNRPTHDAAHAAVTFLDDEALVTYYTRPTNWVRDSEAMLKIFKIEQLV